MTIVEYGRPVTLEQAEAAAAAAAAEARANGWAMVIAIVDSSSHLVLLHRMDHAQYGSIAVAQGKAHSALDFKRPTRVMQDGVAAGGVGLRLLSLDGVCVIEGGLPLLEDGRIIGAIGVSGAAAAQDVQVAEAGARALAREA